ncbi:MAG: fatty acid desaturase [Candidatus Melainabacteria bacterium]|nr:fatty acid desaturase [Candidatus Melainabacteria bacterium]
MSIAAIEQKIRKSIDAKQLREWMKPQPVRVFRDLTVAWLAIGLALICLSKFFSLAVAAPVFVVVGFSQYALFILGHDGLHSCLNSNRKINDLICRWLIYGPMFMGFEDGKRNHLEHHKTLGTDADPDRYIHTLSPKNTPLKFFLFLTGLATFGRTVLKVTPLGVLLRPSPKVLVAEGIPVNSAGSPDFSGAYVGEVQRSESTEVADSWTAQIPPSTASQGPRDVSTMHLLGAFFLKRIPVFVCQAVILSFILLIGLPWWTYPVFWMMPIYFCVFLCDEIRAFCDHAVLTLPDGDADDQRLISFVSSPVESIIFSPHNMNYHAEHHLWPGVPYYNRPQIREVLQDNPQITYRKSYVAFVLDVMRKLPLKETN